MAEWEARRLKQLAKQLNMEVVAALDYKYEGYYIQEGTVTNEPGGIPIYTSLESLAAAAKPDVFLI